MGKFYLILLNLLRNFYVILLIPVIACTIWSKHPHMPYAPETFVGKHMEKSICRLVPRENHEQHKCISYEAYDEETEIKCIRTDCSLFSNYQCISKEDMAMIQKYISILINSCNEWK